MKKAYTIIELIVVIVIVGVLSIVAVPYFSKDDLPLATSQVLSHIRYTQHLAMSEDMFNPTDPNWYLKKWQIRFFKGNGEVFYAVYSDREESSGLKQVDTHIDSALDPLTKYPLFYCNSPVGCTANPRLKNNQVNLTKTFNITDISISCKTNDSSKTNYQQGTLVFDSLGRVYTGINAKNGATPYDYLLTQVCTLALTHSSGAQSQIKIYPETGYAFLAN